METEHGDTTVNDIYTHINIHTHTHTHYVKEKLDVMWCAGEVIRVVLEKWTKLHA